MKSWPSMEALSEDCGFSVRTGWRKLKAGKIQKELYKDGTRIFFFPDSNDSDDDMTSDDGRASHSVIGRETGIEERGDRKRFRTNKISFATIDPSKELINQTERTEIAKLRAEEEEALEKRKGNREHPFVSEMRAKVESKKLNLELQELTKQEDEQRQAEYRRRMIEAVKATVIPPGLRTHLPPDILLVSFRLIDEALKGINFSLDECIALAQSVIWMKYWGGNPTIYGVVRPAIINWIFETLFQNLKDGYAEAMVKGYEGTFNDFLSYIFLSMAPDEQAKISSFAYRKIN